MHRKQWKINTNRSSLSGYTTLPQIVTFTTSFPVLYGFNLLLTLMPKQEVCWQRLQIQLELEFLTTWTVPSPSSQPVSGLFWPPLQTKQEQTGTFRPIPSKHTSRLWLKENTVLAKESGGGKKMRNYPWPTAEDKCPPFEATSTSRHAHRRHHYVLQWPLKVSRLLLTHPEPFKRCPRAKSVTAVSGAAVKPKKQRGAWGRERAGTVLPLPAHAHGHGRLPRGPPEPRPSRKQRSPPHPPGPPEPPGPTAPGPGAAPTHRRGVPGRRPCRDGGKERGKEQEREEAAGGPGQPGQHQAPSGPGAATVMWRRSRERDGGLRGTVCPARACALSAVCLRGCAGVSVRMMCLEHKNVHICMCRYMS